MEWCLENQSSGTCDGQSQSCVQPFFDRNKTNFDGWKRSRKKSSIWIVSVLQVCNIIPICIVQILPCRCIDLTWIKDVQIHLKCNIVNFEIVNGFLYYGNNFGISKLTRLHFKWLCTSFIHVRSVQRRSKIRTRCIGTIFMFIHKGWLEHFHIGGRKKCPELPMKCPVELIHYFKYWMVRGLWLFT